MKINKVVFPVAGLGTRFLPATKASPKEMLPIVDKPLIQYATEEAVAAGITDLIFVTHSSKKVIEDHFDKNYELESELEKRNKIELLTMIKDIVPSNVNCIYVRQPEALGLGHAVLCAQPIVSEEPFAVILPDDLIYNKPLGCLAQMVEIFEQYESSVIGVEPVEVDETEKYGIVGIEKINNQLGQIKKIVEKPKQQHAPSNLAVVGRYILTPRIFDLLKRQQKGTGGEIQLTDSIATLLLKEKVLSYQFKGKRYDCGSKLGYLKATVDFALQREDFGAEFAVFLKKHHTSLFK